MHADIHAYSGVFLVLLIVVVVFTSAARRLRTPYPIVLVVAGLVLSLVPEMPRVALNPDFVFFVVLPPLVFSAAWLTSWRDFSRNLVRILSLACGLVAFTIVAVAAIAPAVFPGFDWRTGALLGAIVGPTDTIAATQIAAQIGLPRRVLTVIEGESLVNDATGLLALEFGAAIAMGGSLPGAGEAIARTAYVTGGSIGLGLAIGYAVYWLERRIDDAPIEITITLLVPFAVYLAADWAAVSGILAVVTCGLFLSRRSPALFSPTVRLQVYAVWGAVVFILNGIVFTMVGLQLPMMLAAMPRWTTGSLLRDAAWFSALVAGLRLAWAFPGARLAHVIRRRLLHHRDPQPRAPEIVVIAWSGMRGAIALAAAASLPAALPQRSRIVFMTFAAVVATLVGQGLTLAPLARALGLTGAAADDTELDVAHRAAIEAAMAHLESIRGRDGPAFAGVYDDLAQHYRERLGALSGADPADRSGDDVRLHDRHRELSSELAGVERATVLRLRDEGRIGDETLREVEHDLDLREARFE